MVWIRALGALGVQRDGEEVPVGGPRQRRLLAALLLHRNEVVSADRLADIVFAGEPTPGAATTMRSYIARIRRAVDDPDAPSRVLTQAPGYRLVVGPEDFDAAAFEQGLERARHLVAGGDPAAADPVLVGTLALWAGDPYAEFADEDWARPEAQRLAELRLVALEWQVDVALARGRAVEVVPELEALVAEHPTREAFRGQLMLALYRAGRHADALAAFQDHRRAMAEELGLDPSPELVALEARILAHDPGLALDEPVGRALRGYRLGERLGTGRDGTVYAARLPGVDRDLVVREVRAAIADDPEVVRSFDARFEQYVALGHPGLVPVRDHWREPGAAYVVMDRRYGGTLADRLRQGPLTEAEAAILVEHVGGALVALAGVGLAHGRIRADDVFWDGAGAPGLGDLGLAGAPDPAADVVALADLVREALGPPAPAVAAVLERTAAAAAPPAIADLVGDLLTALRAGADRSGPTPNPYKGLRAFDESDAPDFFGRTAVVDRLLARLADPDGRLVLVVGGSGSGKSSVVRAGLLPRLRRGALPGSDAWFVTTMVPGSSPFAALGQALERVAVEAGATDLARSLAAGPEVLDDLVRRLVPDGGEVVLLVDQFEELFTAAPADEAWAFLAALVGAVTAPDARLRVVATLRADFYDRPLAVPGLGALVHDATVTVPAMGPAEVETAIVEPAARVGRRVERPLVAELVAAVADEPAGLPALQFALYELAQRSAGDLTLAAYRELGGVEGAIAARAEDLYRTLDDDERRAIRRLFTHLVVVGPEGEPTRRRADRAEVVGEPPDAALDAAVDRWAAARLLTLDRDPRTRRPTVEPAHEALLREWPRLVDWIEEDREALLVLGRLREAAAAWVADDRDAAALYRGARLAVAVDVADRHPALIGTTEADFLAAALAARDEEEAETARRIERQARANRRLRVQLGVIGVALVVALVGGVLAVDQRRDADQQRQVATARELAAASGASLDEDPERAVLLSLAAIDATGEDDAITEAVDALHAGVSASRLQRSVPGLGGSVAWSPDGSVWVTEGPEESGVVDLRDAATGESVRSWTGHGIDVNDVAFSADGSLLATTGDDGALRVWDPATGGLVQEFVIPDGGLVWGPSFSADGSTVAASWLDFAAVRVFDLTTGAERSSVDQEGALATSLSPDGSTVVAGNINAEEVVVADTATGSPRFTVAAGQLFVRDVGFSPDGSTIATAGGDGSVRLWSAATGDPMGTFAEATSEVAGLDWAPEGDRLALAGDDGLVRIVAVEDGGLRQLVSASSLASQAGLQSVSFAPDGRRVVTGDWAVSTAQVWDLGPTGAAEWGNVQAEPLQVGSRGPLAVTPDGLVVVGSGGGPVTAWDVEAGRAVWTLGDPIPGGLERIALSPDGDLLARSGDEGPVELWDVASRRRVASIPTDLGDFPTDLSWSPEGDLLAVAVAGAGGGGLVVVDREGDEQGSVPFRDDLFPTWLAFGAGGDWVAVNLDTPRDDASRRGVRIIDWRTGEVRRTIEEGTGAVAADPAGDRVAVVADVSGSAGIWPADRGPVASRLSRNEQFLGLAWSGDGQRLATGGADGTVRVWDADTGVPVATLRAHDAAVVSVAFDPDGRRLASLDADGVVRVWALDLGELLDLAAEGLTRSLTDDECREYLHRDAC